jgi:hypothetical protein
MGWGWGWDGMGETAEGAAIMERENICHTDEKSY